MRGVAARLVAAGAIGMLLLSGCDGGGPERSDGRLTEPADLSVFDVLPGDCLQTPEKIEAELQDVHAVPCDHPHTQEVFAVSEYDEADVYPGEDKLDEFAQGECVAAFDDYVGVDYVDSSYFFTYLLPSLRSWDERKDRKVVCVVMTTGKELTSSVKGTKR